MSDRIETSSLQAFRPLSQPDSDTGRAVGQWRGESVVAEGPDLATLLDNAKEELAASHSERMESKGIEDRAIDGPDTDRLEQVAAIEEYLERMPDLDPEQLARAAQDLARSEGDPGALMRQARDGSGEPAHAYAALDLAAQGASGERKTALEAARDLLMATEGPAVRAGLNVSRAANDIAQGDRRAAQDLRDDYRATLFAKPGPAALLRGMLDRIGAEDFNAAFAGQVRFLTRALADDLAAVGSMHGASSEPARLEAVISDLSTLRVMDTVHERCVLMSARLGRMQAPPPDPVKLLRALLPLAEEQAAGAGKFSPLPGQMGMPSSRPETGIAFLREARDVLATLPVAVFRDNETRLATLRGVQEAMDIAIEREEGQ